MNGVAFCLVGIPPRPEPRPPKVRALIQERGRIQALPGRWQQGWGRGVPVPWALPGAHGAGTAGHGRRNIRWWSGRGLERELP